MKHTFIIGTAFSLFLLGNVFGASTDDIIITEDTFSVTENTASTDEIISESILLPIQRVGSGDTIVERAHELSLCGNGIIEFLESCDKNNFNGKTCATYGKNSGSLSCTNNCKTINSSACVNVVNPTATPVPTATATPTATPNTNSGGSTGTGGGGGGSGGTGGGGTGGGGYNPVIWTSSQPTPTPSPSSFVDTLLGFLGSPTQTPTPTPILTNTSSDPWLHNSAGDILDSTGSPPSNNVSHSPWLENGTDSTSENLTATGILPFEEWRKTQNLDALPSSDIQAKEVTKQYISYVQTELEKQKNTDPQKLASLLDGSIDEKKNEHSFGNSSFWEENTNNEGFHFAPILKELGVNENGVCHYAWIWLIIIFLLGMITQYLLSFIFFSKKYGK